METLQEFSNFKKSRQEAGDVLDALRRNGGVINNEAGRATAWLWNAAFPDNPHSASKLRVFSSLLKRLEEAGFISRKVNGKRTTQIKLEHYPTDLEPSGEVHTTTEAEVTDDHDAQPELPETEEDVLGRPGRTAARLERTLPDIVDRAVDHAFQQVFRKIGESFGIVTEIQTPDPELQARITVLEDEINKLRGELVFERAAGAEARRERNELREQMTKNAAPQSQLGPHDLDEPWRPLARQAISEGWRIEETSGGHIVWINPLGRKVFSAKTTANRRSIRHTRSDMEAIGLGKARN